MAYPVFSGDMAALNQGFAAQEAAAIQRRAANQNFLAAIAGQMQQSQVARSDQANRLQMAQLQDATARERIQQEGSLGRQANSTNLLKVINDQNNALAQIDNERNRLRVLESQGNAQAGLERQKLEAEGKYRAEQLKNLLEIARVNATARLDPATVRVEGMKQDQADEEFDLAAAATASQLADKVTPDTKWFGNNAVTPDQVAKAMTTEERMMVQYDPVTKTFRPRLRSKAAQAAKSAGITAGPAADGYKFSKPKDGVFRIGELYPEIYSSKPAKGASSVAQPTVTDAPTWSAPAQRVNNLPALRSLAGAYGNQRPVTPLSETPEALQIMEYLGAGQAAQAPLSVAEIQPQPYVPQGPPVRLYDPRASIPRGATRWPDYNPAHGLYAGPDGRIFKIPVSTTGQY